MKKENYQSHDPCVACKIEGEGMTCWHHLHSRGSGGSDEDHNLISTCLKCHNNYHQLGLKFMANKYPSVKEWLLKNEWYFCELTNKWRHDK